VAAVASDVIVVPLADLVRTLTRLEDDHLDHGRRLQAAGVRSAIELVQREVNEVRKADGTSVQRER
jgi:hypothetical protein